MWVSSIRGTANLALIVKLSTSIAVVGKPCTTCAVGFVLLSKSDWMVPDFDLIELMFGFSSSVVE